MTTIDNKIEKCYALQLAMPVQLCYDQGKCLCYMSQKLGMMIASRIAPRTSLFDGLPRFLGPSLVAAALPEPGAPLAAGVALALTFLAGCSSPSVVAFLLATCTPKYNANLAVFSPIVLLWPQGDPKANPAFEEYLTMLELGSLVSVRYTSTPRPQLETNRVGRVL